MQILSYIFIMKILKSFFIILGVLTFTLLIYLQLNYGLVTKIIFAPKLHPKAPSVYLNLITKLLETGDITQASIRKVPVADDISNEDVEEAMDNISTELNIRDVGKLPLSEMVELQTDKKQRFLKIYQYCSPRTAMDMVNYSDSFSAYLPCRISLIEDLQGKRWLYTLDMDMMIYGGKPLPPELHKKALRVQETIYKIMDDAAIGEF